MKTELHAFCIDYPGLARELIMDVIIIPKYPFNEHIANVILKNPTELTFRALWDTGATHSAISPRVVSKCGLFDQIAGFSKVISVNSKTEKPFYMIGGLALPSYIMFKNFELTEGDIGDDIDIIIGMDIILMGDFSISNYNGTTKFCFSCPPYRNKIDLLERSNRVNKK